MLSVTSTSAHSFVSPAAGSGTSNPDQSKHLETARLFIFDTLVDFVNLRSEKYALSSRIPTVEIGTAEEDAYRRDLTINSLFFNINNNSVEDFTGRGIDDLRKGLIVTPLPAKATFLDDPLRVLRAIRFAARFGFTLSEDFKVAASDEKVKSKLGCKISRELVGTEVDLMMSGKHPVQAMSEICDLGLFDVVFAFPKKSNPPVFRCDWWLLTSAAFHILKQLGKLYVLCPAAFLIPCCWSVFLLRRRFAFVHTSV